MSLLELLKTNHKPEALGERPSLDLYAPCQTKQLGGRLHTSKTERAKIKVMIVDDNEDSANMLGAAMQFYGFHVEVAFGGQQALDCIEKNQPDVAVLDLGMPDMSGVELARRVRQTRASGDLLLIALTGWGQEEAGEASKSAGFDFHLVKPADPGNLSALIEDEDFRRRMSGRR